MILVAVVAIPLGAVVRLNRHWRELKDRAVHHRQEIGSLGLSDLETYLILTIGLDWGAPNNILQAPREPYDHKRAAEDSRKMIDTARPLIRFIQYHERLAAKYEFACNHPWLSVAPDPPQPAKPSFEELKSIFNTLQLGDPDPPQSRKTAAYNGYPADESSGAVVLAYGCNLVKLSAEALAFAR